MFNWNKNEKNKTRLSDDCINNPSPELCSHGNRKDSCYFCITNTQPKQEEEKQDPFTSSAFKNV